MSLLTLLGCTMTCGTGTHPDGAECVADAATNDSGTSDTASDTDTDTDSDADTDSDTDTDSGSSWDYGETGPCAPTSAWADAPVPAALLTGTAYDASYDAGISASAALIGGGSGDYSESRIVSGATVVAIGTEPNGTISCATTSRTRTTPSSSSPRRRLRSATR